MDFVQDYVSVNGNAIDGFLKAWQEADPEDQFAFGSGICQGHDDPQVERA